MRYPLKRVGVFVFISVILAVPAPAQTVAEGQDSQDGQAKTPDQPKPPPPVITPTSPTFSKHRRGTYTSPEGVEVVDSTPQSPPLETDDPGVPDKGEYEINLLTHADLSRDVQQFDML